MSYQDKNYTNKNHDVTTLIDVLEEFDTTVINFNAFKELAEQLKGFDLGITGKKNFCMHMSTFSKIYKLLLKINCLTLHYHRLGDHSVFNSNDLSRVLYRVESSTRENIAYDDIRDVEEMAFLNGHGCSLVSLISLASECERPMTMLPMFKIFLEDFNEFLDCRYYYSKKLNLDVSNGTYEQIDSLYCHIGNEFLIDQGNKFNKIDYYITSSVEAVKTCNTNANAKFNREPKSIYDWECEYEFSLISKYLGNETLIKIIVLLALNTLSIYKTYYKKLY